MMPAVFLLMCSTFAEPNQAESPLFEATVRPILRAHCFECHGELEKPKARLDLRLARFMLKGGRSGPAIVPGKPEASILYQRVVNREMPPGKQKLDASEIDRIARWIRGGARVERSEPESLAAGMHFTPEDRSFWAFQPVKSSPAPWAAGQDRVRTPIDGFLLAALREKHLDFALEADRTTLIRRATLDLIGLPPTPEETQAFLADRSPDAYERLIDRLLSSPHYGERWGRHWLDVAGYADTEGYSPEDTPRSNAFRYRDYVIRSFNMGMPFDRFIHEQLAGDEMLRPPYKNLSPTDLEKLVATGFLRMAPDGTGSPGVDLKSASNQTIADTIKIVSTAFLGLTVGCAQCHNHRYDPIPQTDYYRLRAIFEPAFDVTRWQPPVKRRISLYTDSDRHKAQAIEAEAAKVDQKRLGKQGEFITATLNKELAKLPPAIRKTVQVARETAPGKRTAEQEKLLKEYPSVNVSAGSLYLYDAKAAKELEKLAREAAAIRARKPLEEFVRALTEVPGRVPVTRLLHRGEPDQPRQVVAPGGLSILAERWPLNSPAEKRDGATTGRRLAFAHWLTSDSHPLTARVLVNRVWMHHFGRGLVETAGDLGKLGDRPSHPALLDWLASEFRHSGWDLKRLHRLIMTSTAYRQSSVRDPAKDRIDPDNRLLGRMAMRRLEAEAVRDSVLAVSGKLHFKPYGPPIPVREDDVGQIIVGRGMKDLARGSTTPLPLPPGEEHRRSIYITVSRNQPLAIIDTFDRASTEPNCERRNASTATPQALMLLNSDFIVGQASAFAERVRKEVGNDLQAQAVRAWMLAFTNYPSPGELQAALTYLTDQAAVFKKAGKDNEGSRQLALASFCQALLCSNRFLYSD